MERGASAAVYGLRAVMTGDVPYAAEVRTAIREVGEYRARTIRGPPTLGITSEALLATLTDYLADPASVDPRDIRLLERGIRKIGEWRVELYGEDALADVRVRRLGLLRRIRAVVEARNNADELAGRVVALERIEATVSSQIAANPSTNSRHVPVIRTWQEPSRARQSLPVSTTETDYKWAIAGRIRQTRRNKGLSQENFGRLIGKSRTHVNEWENARATPRWSNLVLIADALDVTPTWLLTGHDDETA